jgi:hypothetical protein
VSFFDCCHGCLALVPEGSAPDCCDWHVLVGADGELLAIVCPGCVADDDLLVVELEASLAPA